jgi:small ligand-binding sensory domain FIST
LPEDAVNLSDECDSRGPVKWASAASAAIELERAVDEACGVLSAALQGAVPDLVVAFVSHHGTPAQRLPELIAQRLPHRTLFGCTAAGVIGGSREIERSAGLTLAAAVLPGVEITPFGFAATPGPRDFAVWRQAMGEAATRPEIAFLLLADELSMDVPALVTMLDGAFPSRPKVGGLASGSRSPGGNTLYAGTEMVHAGAVGLALTGRIEVDTVVAQGCRPIGQLMKVTSCRDNVVLELDGRPAAAVVADLFATLDGRDQVLFHHTLFIGIVMREGETEYHQGDFLIRNVSAINKTNGSVVVATPMREGQIVQFHLRDARTSAEDLGAALDGYRGRGLATPEGALLFSCIGRGERLYGSLGHDSAMFRRHLGDLPLAGFFCDGEIGPVAGTTFVHGYTSSFALFRTPKP